mgnify:CR=1 FL=1
MSIIEPRIYYKPFEYQDAFDFYKNQHRAHWLADEVPLSSDLNDWKLKLTESEKNLIGNIPKSLAQTETYVNDYWSTKVAVWFPKHEIKAMACAFADFESIHAEAYARLNEELGLDDFEAFMEDEEAKAKIDRLVEQPGDTLYDRALSLAIFSAFTEGVNLFSSFAVLLSFKLSNKLKGVGQIVEWSIRDESMHSDAGCWLFRTLVKENPKLKTQELEAACLKWGLKINSKKCRIMSDADCNIMIDREEVQTVNEFVFLGSMLPSTTMDVNRKRALASAAFGRL